MAALVIAILVRRFITLPIKELRDRLVKKDLGYNPKSQIVQRFSNKGRRSKAAVTYHDREWDLAPPSAYHEESSFAEMQTMESQTHQSLSRQSMLFGLKRQSSDFGTYNPRTMSVIQMSDLQK